MKTDLFGFKKKLKAYNTMKNELPPIIATEAKNFFVRSFTNQGFTDTSLESWEEVKRRIPDTKEYMYPKKKGLGRRTRAINVKTGRLRKSIIVKSAKFSNIVIGPAGVDYAEYVNDARPFLGKSQVLNKKLTKKLKATVDEILKS